MFITTLLLPSGGFPVSLLGLWPVSDDGGRCVDSSLIPLPLLLLLPIKEIDKPFILALNIMPIILYRVYYAADPV